MHYCKHNLGEDAILTGHLSPVEYGVYMRLKGRYLAAEAPPSFSLVYLWAQARTKRERRAVDAVLDQFYVPDEENQAWVCDEFEQEIREYQKTAPAPDLERKKQGDLIRKRRQREKAAALRQELARHGVEMPRNTPIGELEVTLARVSRVTCHADVTRDPSVTSSVTGVTLTVNQEPITTNQEPEKTSTFQSDAAAAACHGSDVTRDTERDTERDTGRDTSRVTPMCDAAAPPPFDEKPERQNPPDPLAASHENPPDPLALNIQALTAVLREQGVHVDPGDAVVRKWAAAGLTREQAAAAVAKAKQRRRDAHSNQRVNLGYLTPLVDEALANSRGIGGNGATHAGGAPPPKVVTALERLQEEARRIGVTPKAGESYEELAVRMREKCGHNARNQLPGLFVAIGKTPPATSPPGSAPPGAAQGRVAGGNGSGAADGPKQNLG